MIWKPPRRKVNDKSNREVRLGWGNHYEALQEQQMLNHNSDASSVPTKQTGADSGLLKMSSQPRVQNFSPLFSLLHTHTRESHCKGQQTYQIVK